MIPSFGSDKSNKDQERYFELLNKQNQILEDNGRSIIQLLTTLIQKIDKKDQQIDRLIQILEQTNQNTERLSSASRIDIGQKPQKIVDKNLSNQSQLKDEFILGNLSHYDADNKKEKPKLSRDELEKELLDNLSEFMGNKLNDKDSKKFRESFDIWNNQGYFSHISLRDSHIEKESDEYSTVLLFLSSDLQYFNNGANALLYVRSNIPLISSKVVNCFSDENNNPIFQDANIEQMIQPAYLKYENSQDILIKKGKVKLHQGN